MKERISISVYTDVGLHVCRLIQIICLIVYRSSTIRTFTQTLNMFSKTMFSGLLYVCVVFGLWSGYTIELNDAHVGDEVVTKHHLLTLLLHRSLM